MKTNLMIQEMREVDVPDQQIIKMAAELVLDALDESLQLQDRVCGVIAATIDPPFCRLVTIDDIYPRPEQQTITIRVTDSQAYLAATFVTLKNLESKYG